MTTISSILRDISPSLAALTPGVSVCVAWNPGDNSDVGWVTFLPNTQVTGATTLTNTGLVFRHYTGDQSSLVRLVTQVLDLLPHRMSWQVHLAWDSLHNRDIGWLCTWGPIPSNWSLYDFQFS